MNDTVPGGLIVGNDLHDIQKSLFNDLELTEKQFFSFYMYSNGYSDKQISNMNNTTVDNIKYHLSVVTKKLDCNSRAELRLIYLSRLMGANMRLFSQLNPISNVTIN